MVEFLIEKIPLWGILLMTFAFVWGMTEFGHFTGAHRSRTRVSDDEQRINVMTGANLGLMGFILVFSFNGAAGHHGERKRLVLEEVNAIETAHLRSSLVDPAVGKPIQALLEQYVALRVSAAPGGETPDNRDSLLSMIEQTEELQLRMWRHIEQLAGQQDFGPRESLLVDAINEVYDIHGLRVYAVLNSRVPISIWAMLYMVLSLAMFGMGYYTGMNGRRSPISRAALTLSVSMVMTLIADLDRPTTGLVRGDQSSLQTLLKNLESRSAEADHQAAAAISGFSKLGSGSREIVPRQFLGDFP